MNDLKIAWEYLTGYAVASHSSKRSRVEWPPHPARVYMALAAAWFETPPVDGDSGELEVYEREGDALRWLQTLGDPELVFPCFDNGSDASYERTEVTVFVPVNDQAGPSASILQSAPTMTRDKQARTFPRRWVGDDPCMMIWNSVEKVGEHLDALSRLCDKVTRIGHSSSLVRMWVEDSDLDRNDSLQRFVPGDVVPIQCVRTVPEGFCELLIDRYGAEPRKQHSELVDKISQLELEKKSTKGKGAKEAKALLDEQLSQLELELKSVPARPPVRPSTGRWTNYRKESNETLGDAVQSAFDADILVLVAESDLRLSAESTLSVMSMLRKAIMQKSSIQPVPDWVSGHSSDGKPLRDGVGHIACIPLLAAGHQYSDGHLLGAGIVFPESVPRQQRGEVLRPLLVDDDGEPKAIELKLGRLGVWTLVRRDWSEPRLALAPETWTRHPSGSKGWATVTPIVLDRFPKADRNNNRSKWTAEVAGLIGQACENIGLPVPDSIQIGTTSWQSGVPRAIQKRRPLRGHTDMRVRDAALGSGYPSFPAKSGSAAKPQVHAKLTFECSVVGPVLLGAGRYLGYGLCLPQKEQS